MQIRKISPPLGNGRKPLSSRLALGQDIGDRSGKELAIETQLKKMKALAYANYVAKSRIAIVIVMGPGPAGLGRAP